MHNIWYWWIRIDMIANCLTSWKMVPAEVHFVQTTPICGKEVDVDFIRHNLP